MTATPRIGGNVFYDGQRSMWAVRVSPRLLWYPVAATVSVTFGGVTANPLPVTVPQRAQGVYVALTPGNAPATPPPVSVVLSPPPLARSVPPTVQVYLGITPPVAAVAVTPAVTVTAERVTQPPQTVRVLTALNPAGFQAAPTVFPVAAAAVPQPLQPALHLRSIPPGDPRYPAALQIQAQALAVPLQVALALPGPYQPAAPVAAFFVPTVQAIAVPQPLQSALVALGLTPGTPPATVTFALQIAAQAVSQPLQAAQLQLGLIPGLPRYPVVVQVQASNVGQVVYPSRHVPGIPPGLPPNFSIVVRADRIAVPLQAVRSLTVINPQQTVRLPNPITVYFRSTSQPLQRTPGVYVSLTPGNAPVISYPAPGIVELYVQRLGEAFTYVMTVGEMRAYVQQLGETGFYNRVIGTVETYIEDLGV